MSMNQNSQPSEQLLEAVEEITAILQGLSPKDRQVIDLHDLHFSTSPLPNGAKEFSVWGIVDYLIFVRERDGVRHIKNYIKADWETHILEILSSYERLRLDAERLRLDAERLRLDAEAVEYWGPCFDFEHPVSGQVDTETSKPLVGKLSGIKFSRRWLNWRCGVIGLLVIVVAGSLAYFASTGWKLPCKCTITSNLEVVEIRYNGAVPRVESDEYVVIKNTGDQSQNLLGWVLKDISDGYPSFTFPPYVLAAGGTIRVYTNEVHSEWGGFSFGSGQAIWNNEEPDTAALFDCEGHEVSRKTYNTVPPKTVPPKTVPPWF